MQECVTVDSIGAPVLSDWQQKSFATGEASLLRRAAERNRDEQDKEKRLEDLRAAREEEGRRRRHDRLVVTATIEGMQEIDIGADGGGAAGMHGGAGATGAGAGYDFSAVLAVTSGSSSKKDQDELVAYLPSVLPVLTEIFNHYVGAGVSKRSDALNRLTFLEFTHFIHKCRIYHADKDQVLIKRLVLDAKKRIARQTDPHSVVDEKSALHYSLDRTEFLAVVAMVAVEIAGAGKARACEAVRSLVENFIDARWISQDPASKTMRNDKIVDLVKENRPALKDIFKHFVGDGNNNGGGGGGSGSGGADVEDDGVMSLLTFTDCMRDSGLLTRNPGERADLSDARTRQLASSAFFAVQGNPARNLELAAMVFAEFVDAVCRLCMDVLSAKMTPIERIEVAMSSLQDLKKNLGR